LRTMLAARICVAQLARLSLCRHLAIQSVAIPISLVKDLREKTGASVSECKKALESSNGSIDEAFAWLRKKGLAAASKKSGRVAAEGLVGVAISEDRKSAAIVEVNSETDFVSRNESFQKFVSRAATFVLKQNGSVTTAAITGDLAGVNLDETKKEVEGELVSLVATIGENIQVRRGGKVHGDLVGCYVHSGIYPNTGRIGAIVGLSCSSEVSPDTILQTSFANQLAMHIVAASPLYLSRKTIPEDVIENEKAVARDQARDNSTKNKPESVIAKMVEGRLMKFMQENVLLEQKYLIDAENDAKTVGQVLGKMNVQVTGFVKFQCGEGIEKASANLAKDVAELASSFA